MGSQGSADTLAAAWGRVNEPPVSLSIFDPPRCRGWPCGVSCPHPFPWSEAVPMTSRTRISAVALFGVLLSGLLGGAFRLPFLAHGNAQEGPPSREKIAAASQIAGIGS